MGKSMLLFPRESGEIKYRAEWEADAVKISKGPKMKPKPGDDFIQRRSAQNKTVLQYADKTMKRFLNLDHNAYAEGRLPAKSKELLGLVASLVLRCDDCVKYHLMQCFDQGVTDDELAETLSIGLIVGGSITIPHLRRALEFWDNLK